VSKHVQDVMDALKLALEAKPFPDSAALSAERTLEARWCGRWRLVQAGITFKVTAVRTGNVHCHSRVGGPATIKVADMEFLTASGELQFIGK